MLWCSVSNYKNTKYNGLKDLIAIRVETVKEAPYFISLYRRTMPLAMMTRWYQFCFTALSSCKAKKEKLKVVTYMKIIWVDVWDIKGWWTDSHPKSVMSR
ncbi:hypothetical protein AVEN_80719-1 [Araneus ventricosus]|uniref:Uncharacterized protein n=1 Tax=Araneus ventricosus TaxID=182803 RepID=A0A4Y2H168_ARAVE|nr:hypothetical protein AVEN_80719-1 [Araneus ventricosus]